MNSLALLERCRDLWRAELADATRRAAADRSLAATQELDAIDDNIAGLRLRAAAELLETGVAQ